MSVRYGVEFYKLTGSGNDFVAFDEFAAPGGWSARLTAERIQALCRRGLGVGADGVVRLLPTTGAAYRLVYYNSDGSRAALCGNASLCTIQLAVELGYAHPGEIRFDTDDGPMQGRLDGLPEFDLSPPSVLDPTRGDLERGRTAIAGEQRLGYAVAGVPHVVVLCDDADAVNLDAAAAPLRHHALLPDGANVNVVSRAGQRWRIRTFERGVEAETLACGTGSVATALLLDAWGEVAAPSGAERSGEDHARAGDALAGPAERQIELMTTAGLVHRVRLREGPGSAIRPSLAGDARIVFRGRLGEGDWTV